MKQTELRKSTVVRQGGTTSIEPDKTAKNKQPAPAPVAASKTVEGASNADKT